MTESIESAAEIIRNRAGAEPIDTVVALGPGLGATMDNALEGQIAIPYAELPGFPALSLSGRDGRLTIGRFEGVRAACLVGCVSYHEQGDLRAMAAPFEALAARGAKTLLLTCTASSVNADIQPGLLALVTDHVNLTGLNPLIGENSEACQIAMTESYDPRVLRRLRRASVGGGVPLREGVYMWFPGPSLETPAEIRAARALGAELVGASLVPDSILAHRYGLRVGAVVVVTNYGAGFCGGNPSVAQIRDVGQQGAIALKRLLRAFFKAREESWGAMGREALR